MAEQYKLEVLSSLSTNLAFGRPRARMHVLLPFTALITLTVAVYGEVKLEDDSGPVQREYGSVY